MPSHGRGRRAGVAVLLVLAVAAIPAVQPPAQAASIGRTFVLYSVAQQEQYVNNADDRARGTGNNPFGTFSDTAPSTTKNGNGPFPGDEALFSFNLYSGPGLSSRAGAAIFTCQYNFAKNAFCDATFRLKDGTTIVASGSFNFDASKFSLAVTGGTGRFVHAKGNLNASPSAGHAQRLSFAIG
jgi:hypothetical protein